MNACKLYACVYVRIYVFMSVNIMYASQSACMYAYVRRCMHRVCIRVFCVCVYGYMCMYNKNVCVYIYTHIDANAFMYVYV